MAEEVQDRVIADVEQQAEHLLERTAAHDPELAERVDAAAQRRKLEIERDLILRRRGYPR